MPGTAFPSHRSAAVHAPVNAVGLHQLPRQRRRVVHRLVQKVVVAPAVLPRAQFHANAVGVAAGLMPVAAGPAVPGRIRILHALPIPVFIHEVMGRRAHCIPGKIVQVILHRVAVVRRVVNHQELDGLRPSSGEIRPLACLKFICISLFRNKKPTLTKAGVSV